ncbi:MAG TPA: hypothetical protein VFK06_07105 [Candidatus Angelobacter sp.]|nr:hypothetical protein [Candidatus Angelobacter sp.]
MVQYKSPGNSSTLRQKSRHICGLLARSIFVLQLVCMASAQSNNSSSSTAVPQSGDKQAALLVAEAQSALNGTTVVSDMALTAQGEWSAGSTHVSGSATLKMKGAVQSRLDIAAGELSRSEIRNDSAGPGGQWIDGRGVRHAMALHNAWSPAGWLAPHALVQGMLDKGIVLHYVGAEVRDGVSVDHLQLYRAGLAKNPRIARDTEKLSLADLFLDASTHLPQTLVYNTHPDNDYGRDIPVEVRFFDYRSVNGVMVPFRIQRFLQGVLNLDLTVSAAEINSGLTDSEFALQ